MPKWRVKSTPGIEGETKMKAKGVEVDDYNNIDDDDDDEKKRRNAPNKYKNKIEKHLNIMFVSMCIGLCD